jgi:hypothetical protein
MARKKEENAQRLTVYLPEGAVPGRVLDFTETGLTAYVDTQVPRYERLRFTLHLPGAVLTGEAVCLAQEERTCRLQFAGLTPEDRLLLEPYLNPEEPVAG